MNLGRPLPRSDVRHQAVGVGYPLWVLFAQASVVVFMFIGFDTIGHVSPQPYFALSVVLIAAMVLFAPRGTFRRTRVSVSVVLFLSWWMLSYTWSTSRATWISKSMSQFVAILSLTMVASVLPMERLRGVWLGGLYAMVAYTFLYTVTVPGSTTANDAATGGIANVGWHGPFDHKNILASFMVVGMLSVLTFEHNIWRRRLGVAAMVALVLLSRSGTGAGAMAASLAILALTGRYAKHSARKGGALVTMSMLASVIAISGASLFLPSILKLYGKDITLTGRTDIWAGVWPAIRDKQWTGYGWGGVWVDPSREPTTSILRRIGFVVFHAHNGALELMLELGVVGLALYLCVFAAAVDGGRRLLKVDPALGQLVLAYCMLVFISSVTEVLVVGPWLSILVFLRVLSMRTLAERGHASPGSSETVGPSHSRARRPAAASASAALAMAANGSPDRVAMSRSDRVPSDWFSTQSRPISTERESIPPPIAE